MSNAVHRALSPWPTWLVAAALTLLFGGEHLLVGENSRWIAVGLAGLAFVGGFGLRLVRRPDSSIEGRPIVNLSLLFYAIILGGCISYLGHLMTLSGPTADNSLSVMLYGLALFLMTSGAAALVGIELATFSMRRAAFAEVRRARAAALTGITLAFALTGIVLINYATTERGWRWDLSFGAPTSPSEATLNLIQAAESPVEIFMFFPRGNRLHAEVANYFEGLEDAGARLMTLDQASDPDLAESLKVTGNGYIALRSGERSGKWYLGTDLESARVRLKKMDEGVRTELAKLTVAPRTVYFTLGHGERGAAKAQQGEEPQGEKLRDTIRGFNAKPKHLSMAEGLASQVPADADLVIVFGPRSPFLDAEARAIKSYAERGGSLLLLLDPRFDHGLDEVLTLFGLSHSRDEVCNDRVYLERSGGKADHAFLVTNAFSNHAAIRTLASARGRAALALLSAGHLTKTPGPSKGKQTFIVRALNESFVDLNGNRTFDADQEKRGPLNLAAAIELPGVDGGEASRIAVVADSDLVADLLIGNQTNFVFSYEILGWLLGEDRLGGELSGVEDVPIRHTRESDTIWFYGSTFAAPLLVLGLGLGFVAHKRRRRAS